MQDLQLIGVHEDGEHLLLRGADDERFQMPVDDTLRAAIRRDRPHLGQLQIEGDGGLRPRDVQALIRAGASTDEAANRAGWSVEKVQRYAGPILAEREHVAGLAQQARLRSRAGDFHGGSAPTLSARVSERLKERDVEVTDADWDSWRAEGGPWTVVLTFAAGGSQRQASWTFNLADRTVAAVDDEALWLSEEVRQSKGPIPAPHLRPASGRDAVVYDVEAEGGLRGAAHDQHQEDPLDLMTAMRKRSTARGRRKPGGRSASPGSLKAPASVPSAEPHSDESPRPLEDRPKDPERMPTAAVTRSPEPATALADHGDHGDHHVDSVDAVDESSPDDVSSEGSSIGDPSHPPVVKSKHKGQPTRRPKLPAQQAARKTGRPSVPAWDEIMFGSRSGGDRSPS
jgi:hypothetical protein